MTSSVNGAFAHAEHMVEASGSDLDAGGRRGVRANRWFDDRRNGVDGEYRVQRTDWLDGIRHQLRKQRFEHDRERRLGNQQHHAQQQEEAQQEHFLDRDWRFQLPQQHGVRQLGEVARSSGVQRHTGEPAVK